MYFVCYESFPRGGILKSVCVYFVLKVSKFFETLMFVRFIPALFLNSARTSTVLTQTYRQNTRSGITSVYDRLNAHSSQFITHRHSIIRQYVRR
jgi:hypothetical protein